MKIFDKIFSLFKGKIEENRLHNEESAKVYGFDLFTQFTQDLIDIARSKYDINSGIEVSGFFARTEYENQPCFLKKFITNDGSNLWFYMLYNQDTMEITELHIVNHKDGFKSEYNTDVVSKFKQSFELKASLEKEMINTKPEIKKIVKV